MKHEEIFKHSIATVVFSFHLLTDHRRDKRIIKNKLKV